MHYIILNRKLLQIIESVAPGFPPEYRYRADSSKVDVLAGEQALAFDTICENLYEFDIPISRADHDLIVECGQALNLDPILWTRLIIKGTSTNPPGAPKRDNQ